MNNLVQYIGIDYSELNCWELVRRIYGEQLHIDLPLLPIESREVENWNRVRPGHELDGDLILFRVKELKRHVGIVIGDGKMIHSDRKAGVVVERYNVPLWQCKLLKIYRHGSRN